MTSSFVMYSFPVLQTKPLVKSLEEECRENAHKVVKKKCYKKLWPVYVQNTWGWVCSKFRITIGALQDVYVVVQVGYSLEY